MLAKNKIIRMKKTKSLINNLALGTLALSFSAIIIKVIGVVYKVPLSYILNDEGMGYFNSAYTVYGFFYVLCSAGVPKAVTLMTEKVKSEWSSSDERKLIRTTLLLFSIIGLTVTVVLVIFASPISKLIGNSKAYATILAIAPSIFFVSVSGVLKGYLNAYSSLLPIAISQVIEAIFKLCLGLLFAVLGAKGGLPLSIISALTVIGISLGTMFSCLYLFIISKNKIPHKIVGQKTLLTSKSIIKDVCSLAFPICISSSILSISSVFDLAMIMRRLEEIGYSEPEASAIFGNYTTLAVPMMNLVISIISPISIAALPLLANAHLKGKEEEFIVRLNKTITASVSIAAPCTLVLMLYPRETLDILYSDESSSVGAPMLKVLSPAILLLTVLTVVNTALEARTNIKIPVISLIVGAIAKIFVGYLLIGNERFGIIGAPIGTIISYAVSLLISLTALLTRIKGIKLTNSIIIPMVLAIIAFVVPHKIIKSFGYEIDSVITYGCICLISVIIYALIMLFRYLLGKKRFKKMQNAQNCVKPIGE